MFFVLMPCFKKKKEEEEEKREAGKGINKLSGPKAFSAAHASPGQRPGGPG